VNAVDLRGTQLLVSARNASTIFDVNIGTGQINWILGGKQNQFKVPSNLVTGPNDSVFQYQHDPKFVPGAPGEISLFDDAGLLIGSPNAGPYGPSRGMIFRVNARTRTATVVGPIYNHDPAVYPDSQGDVEPLSNGNVFIGWGADVHEPGFVQTSYYSEYSSNGTLLYDALLPGDNISYRAYRFPWVGIPLTKPSVAVVANPSGGTQTVYASWNGATLVNSWQLLTGPAPFALRPASITPRTSFETTITTTNAGPYFEVRALGAGGRPLGTSIAVTAS
jgi:hypothetical protein